MVAHRPHVLFWPTFSKAVAPRVVAPRRAGAPAVSFWELFLCGSCPKEKVDKWLDVTIVSGTDFKYQDFLAAFLWHRRRLLSCLTYVSHLITQNRKEKLWKRNAEHRATTETPKAHIHSLRGTPARPVPPPPLKRWTKQPLGLCEICGISTN